MKVTELSDPVDIALLPVLRHAARAFSVPEAHSWRLAFRIAAERWGEARGLALAQHTIEVVAAFLAHDICLSVHDPLDLTERGELTAHEHQVLLMLRFMRNKDTANARFVLEQLCGAFAPADIVRAALSLANRLDPTVPNRVCHVPELRAVS